MVRAGRKAGVGTAAGAGHPCPEPGQSSSPWSLTLLCQRAKITSHPSLSWPDPDQPRGIVPMWCWCSVPAHAAHTDVCGTLGLSPWLVLELGAFFSLRALLISGRLWIRDRGKCPSVVLAPEIIEPFFTYGQSNSVHILIFLLIAWGCCCSCWIRSHVQSFSVIAWISYSLANWLLVS